MKKIAITLLWAGLSILLMNGPVMAATLDEEAERFAACASFDEQLAVLDQAAGELAEELELKGWERSFTREAAPGFPEKLIPEDWEKLKFAEENAMPEAMIGHKFIALYSPDGYESELMGDFLIRFPEEMRAASLAEAEYALIVRSHYVPSGYVYMPPANSSHCDYEAYVVDLKNGGYTRFWAVRNNAKKSGLSNRLNGDNFSQQELWRLLYGNFFTKLRLEQGEAALTFCVRGENAFLHRVEGKVEEIDIPDEVEGYSVNELARSCFADQQELRSVRLPQQLRIIADSAFKNCSALERIDFPEGLEEIGAEAFSGCSSLQQAEFPDSLRIIGSDAFTRASSLTSLFLPARLTTIGENAFSFCSKLASVTVEDGRQTLPSGLLQSCYRLACCYLPDSLSSRFENIGIDQHAAIYTRAGSPAFQWAKENEYELVLCSSPSEMPEARYVQEGDWEFRLFRGEAAVSAYLGCDSTTSIPETAEGLPVAEILVDSINYGHTFLEKITLPRSLKTVRNAAFALLTDQIIDIYVPNPETSFEKNAVWSGTYAKRSLHAPEESLAQQYVKETEGGNVVFEAWEPAEAAQGASDQGRSPASDARFAADALWLAKDIQKAVSEFWEKCEQTEYAWLENIPNYKIEKPAALGIIRLSPEQMGDLSAALGEKSHIASAFASYVNSQWNQPYQRAADESAQNAHFVPAPDGLCTLVALVYPSDIVLTAIQENGAAEAALICSSPDIIRDISSEFILGYLEELGVAGGECRVYKGEEVKRVLKIQEK